MQADVPLVVRGESIQQAYGAYRSDRYQVNRRYQRKLVWSVEEKERLIDSIMLALPLPLFLVAESTGSSLELIDGMQRLNAIFSFIEQEFSYQGEYFDLDTLADTKALKDAGKLKQHTPLMARPPSVYFANYVLALSVFKADDQSSIDEVFRRINSGGKRLSKQELRQAGTISPLADLIRRVAAAIRTDNSPGDKLPLRLMPELSISNKNLAYGIFVDDIYWVHENILRSNDVRESADEQVILDIVIDLLVHPAPTSNNRTRDEHYNFTSTVSPEQSKASIEMASSISMYGEERFQSDFLAVYDVIRAVVESSDSKFASLLGVPPTGRAPRYYHALFVAVYELMNKDRPRRIISDSSKAALALRNIARSVNIPSGGDWQSASKRQTIDSFKGQLVPATETVADNGEDPGRFGWASELETLLANSLVENQLFDCKQGFYTVASRDRTFDADSFNKAVRTLTAIANMGKNRAGYVVVGIADDTEDAARIASIDDISPRKFRNFNIVGIEREAQVRSEALNDYWSWIVRRLSSHPEIGQDFARTIGREAKLVPYHGFAVGVIRITQNKEPQFFGSKLYERVGSETIEVPQSQFMRVYSRFT